MERTECLSKLKVQYFKDTNQKNNISKLTTESWGDDKMECINQIWWISQIKLVLSDMEKWESTKDSDTSLWNIRPCEQKLINTYIKNFAQKENLSKLATDARWDDKIKCLNEIGWYNQIKKFLERVEERYEEQYDTDALKVWDTPAIRYESNKNNQTTTGTEEHASAQTTWTSVAAPVNDEITITPEMVWSYALYTFIGLFAIYRICFLIKQTFRYVYSFLNTNRMVFIKVLLPKGDGKTDREQEKEVAKDMKEKIWRMTQLYNGLHKISEISTWDSLMHKFFGKQKIVLIYQYEEWELSFIVWTYPEYQSIVESSISAQYPTCSLEQVAKPKPFQKKFYDILTLEPKRDPVYTIKTFKQMPDDPINNVIDTMSKVSVYDTVTSILTIKPESEGFNAKRQKAAERLYKWLDLYKTNWWHWSNLFNPIKIFKFLVFWPSEKLISNKKEEENVSMVRMVRTKEEAMNTIWEEAGNPTYRSWLIIISSSNEPWQAEKNLKAMESAYNVYNDEYSNGLTDDNTKHDLFGFIYKKLWKIAAKYYLTWFFYNYSYFSTNELTSLFHFADWIYNRSPIIEWMIYKVLPAPSNLPQFSDDEWNGRIMTWQLAEKFKNWDLSEILKDYKNHWAVSSRVLEEEKLTPLEDYLKANPNSKVEEANGKETIDWKQIIIQAAKDTVKEINDEGKEILTPLDKYLKKHSDSEVKEADWKKTIDWNEIISEPEMKMVKEMVPWKTVYWYKLYKNAVLLWTNIYRNNLSPVYIKREDRTRHHYMIWKSGTWKSVFLQTMARQDLWNWDGICLIDPHGDLAEDVLDYVPKERAKDVIYFDAGNEDRPMGLNLYEINSLDEADRTVNDATEIFLKMFWPEIFGPRIQEYFKYGSLTILEDFDDRPTLLDVVRLFTDDAYRELKVAKVTNAVVRNWWERTYNSMGDREKAEIIPYFSSKFVSFNTNRLIRNIIGQTKSAFNFDDVMNNQKILLVNLSKGKIWEINAQLLGMILVSKIYNSAMGRAKMEAKDRKDFFLYVDEFQNFVSGTFADILSEARKYRLALIMAHQYIAQLETKGWDGGGKADVKAAVFGNVGTMMSFKIGAPDAEFMEKEYAPLLGPQDIVGIANYKSYIKLNIDNATTKVFSMNSIYTKDYINKKIAPILMEYSAKKYWRAREFVDAEMSTRLGVSTDLDELPWGGTPNGWEASGEWNEG